MTNDVLDSKPEPLVSAGYEQVVALVWSFGPARDWFETVMCLSHISGVTRVVFNCKQGFVSAAVASVMQTNSTSLRHALNQLFTDGCRAVLVVFAPIWAVRSSLLNGLCWLQEDRSVATVSFLSNDAGHLSFPHRNTPVPVYPEGFGSESLTDCLQQGGGDIKGTTVLLPEGPAILVSQEAYWTLGGIDDAADLPSDAGIKDFGLRANKMGLRNILDPTNYILAPWEGSTQHKTSMMDEPTRAWLRSRHGGEVDKEYDQERVSQLTPAARALDYARARTIGLRILIDGSCLGPQEMGTQNLTVALARHLAEDKRVREVYLAVPRPDALPPYVQALQTISKLQFTAAGGLDFPDAPDVDIIHRPYQPGSGILWGRWRQFAKRTVITIQDLIAYRNGAYFSSYEDWLDYRMSISQGCKFADAVVAISHDVVRSMHSERLDIAESRVTVIPNGTDFEFRKSVRVSAPREIVLRGWERERFLLVLGANYAHKNRDLGIRVWQLLRRQGLRTKLILAGASVPRGSIRSGEAKAVLTEPDLLRLADVPAGERDWLMSNASLVIYPTSAEGFGFLPFEAAAFGVPTLHVGFGPLLEMIDDAGVPEGWEVEPLAARAKLLLEDKAAAEHAVARVMARASELSWSMNASRHVDRYLSTLRDPANEQL